MKPPSRRDMGAALALGLLAPSGALAAARGAFQRRRLPIGAELYSLGDLARQDLAGSLKQLAAIGYRTTELAGYVGHTPAEIRRAHDAAGLACTSAHVQVGPGTPEEPGVEADAGRLAEHMHIIGVRHVVVPGFPIPADLNLKPEPDEGYAFYARVSRALTESHWKARAALLNACGRSLRAHGLKIGFHNHSFEFAPVGGRSGMDILLSETDPALVTFELDVGWAFAAGLDPGKLIQAHPGRFGMLHIKDMKTGALPGASTPMRSTEVGAGAIAWRPILAAAYADGVREMFVEQEPPFEHPRLEALAQSFAYLRALNF